MMNKRHLILLLSVIFLISHCFSNDWIISAIEFEIEDSVLISDSEMESLKTIASSLPTLMLDNLPLGSNRTVFPEEILQRDLYEIRKNQQSLYEQINSQIVTRDTYVFTSSSSEFDKKIETSNKNIKSLENKLVELDEKEKKLYIEYEKKKEKNPENQIEAITVYKNDSTSLFKKRNQVLSQKEINSAGIRALISGKIFYNHGYIQVESTLTLYPENRVISTASEIGTIKEIEYIAQSSMNVLLSSMVNDQLIHADIFINPKEVGDNATVFIEDAVYHGSVISADFTVGTHVIRVESPDYETVYFTYDYKNGQNKIINIEMQKKQNVEMLFVNNDKSFSDIYLNTVLYGKTPIVASISNSDYLGEIVNESGNSSYFVLRNGLSVSDSGNQNVYGLVHIENPRENLEKKIDKSRKRMYWSYGGLIMSVPLVYLCKGMLNQAEINGSAADPNAYATWKTLRYVSLGVLAGTGVNFITQLIIYLVDANRVIPKIVYSEGISEVEAQEYFENAEAEFVENDIVQLEEKLELEENKLDEKKEGN